MKKAAKASYNVVIGDDIRTLTSKNTKWYQKVVSGALIAANFIPVVGPAASVTAKVAIKGTVATVKAVKTTSSAKKVATAANKTPKTVAAKSIKSTPKIQESKSVTANNVTPQAPPKVNLTKQPDRNNTSIRLKASEDTTKSIGNVGRNLIDNGEEISKDIVNINKKYSSGFEQNNSITNIVNSASYYDNPWDKVSAITRSIADHAFVDGNKRTSFDTLNMLLKDMNLKSPLSDKQKWDLVNKLGKGEIKDVSAITRILKGY